jgi:hypothetical protein
MGIKEKVKIRFNKSTYYERRLRSKYDRLDGT